MASSHISGPSIVYGDSGVGSSAGNNSEAGPSVTYQGGCVLDVRSPYQPGVTGRGVVRGFLDSPYIASVDAVPSTLGAAVIAAAQAATSGTALTLVSTNSVGVGVNFPVVPFGRGIAPGNVVPTVALDPGFATVSTTSASKIVTLSVGSLAILARMVPGLALLVGAATNAWTVARIVSVSGTNVTLDVPMPATNGTAVIALATGSFRNDQTPLASISFLTAGAAAVFDPRSGLTRGVSVTTAGANAGGTVTVSGLDIYSVPMSETIACATAGTFYGNKCFKFVTSAVPAKSGGGALTGTVSVGTSDLFGFNTRIDAYEYTNVYWAGAFMGSSAGWYAADTTVPATAITKDVRGVVQVSASGPNGTAIGTSASNGSRRLQIYMSLPLDNLAFATVSNPAPLFGVPQA